MIKIVIYGFPTSGKTEFLKRYSGPYEAYDTDRLLPLLVPGFSWEAHNHPLARPSDTNIASKVLFSELRKWAEQVRTSVIVLTNYHLPADLLSKFDICIGAIPKTFEIVKDRFARRGDKLGPADVCKWKAWWSDSISYLRESNHYDSKLFLDSDEYLSDFIPQICG